MNFTGSRYWAAACRNPATASAGGTVSAVKPPVRSFTPLPGNQMKMTFTDFLKPGDRMTLTMDLATNHPLAASVATTMDSDGEPVTLQVQFSTLDNSAVYASDITLDAKGKHLRVNVTNSGYRRSNP